jgi:hypothetical protein
MNPHLLFTLGMLSGSCLSCFCFALYHGRKIQEARDEFTSLRFSIRQSAYSKGYEDAKQGGLKR